MSVGAPPLLAVLKDEALVPDFPAGVKCEDGVKYFFPDPRAEFSVEDDRVVVTTYGVPVVILATDVVEIRHNGKKVFPK